MNSNPLGNFRLAGDQGYGDDSGGDTDRLQASHAFFKQHRGQADGNGRIERGKYGGNIESTALGGGQEQGIAERVECAGDDDERNEATVRQPRPPGDDPEQGDGKGGRKTCSGNGPEQSGGTCLANDDQEQPRGYARDDGESQSFGGTPSDLLRLGKKPESH